MQQLQIQALKTEEMVKKCVFTGHRVLQADFSEKKLKKEIETLIKKGVDTFYNGMAMGFDLLSAELVLKQKKKNAQIKLIACVPCYGQEKNFSQQDKKRYVNILKKADEIITLSDKYYQGCMQNRDKYMAERADIMIAYCNKQTGGAAYTVKCFQKSHPFGEIVYI